MLTAVLLGLRLHYYRRPVRQHFGHTLHDLSRVIAHADDGIRAHHRTVLDHDLESFPARLLAQLREDGDIPANDGLQRRAKVPDDGPRAHGDAAHHPEILGDLECVQLECRGHVLVGDASVHSSSPESFSCSICCSVALCRNFFAADFFFVSGSRRVAGTVPTTARAAAFTAVTALKGFDFFFFCIYSRLRRKRLRLAFARA